MEAPAADPLPSLDRFEGCLLGLMVGDCLGLPREGLSPRRAQRLFGPAIRHAFLPGRGMASDDTEHACLTAQALLDSPSDPAGFQRRLAWGLRLWLLGLPAGVGLATLRSVLKLWAGFPPGSSGVPSAGNGPAMRSPVAGIFFSRDPERLEAFVEAGTRLTHTDPRAVRGALATAVAVRYGAASGDDSFSTDEALARIAAAFPEDDREARAWLDVLGRAVKERWTGERFSRAMGFQNGVSGYIYHTVPAALWAWLAGPRDFRGGMERILRLGGDTDTAGAVLGALGGATAGASGIPEEWLEGICEYPRSVRWVRDLARALHARAGGSAALAPPLPWAWIFPRNLFFLGCVLAHGFRRLLPPY